MDGGPKTERELGSFELRQRIHDVLLQFERLTLELIDSIQRLTTQSAALAKKLPSEVLTKPELLMRELISVDRLLQSYVSQLCVYQEKKKQIVEGQRILHQGQRAIGDAASDLIQVEEALSHFRDRAMEHLEAYRKAKKDEIRVSGLLSYAQQISHTRPVGHLDPSQQGFPFPKDIMRTSVLFTQVDMPKEARMQIEKQQKQKGETLGPKSGEGNGSLSDGLGPLGGGNATPGEGFDVGLMGPF
mmetsp:Transcript_36608/g.50355  ORF Transcript_36608/g.50355 Transcript_36608/m.50355 type:complete len:244 (+) Transcript_36608:65-796(+)|eukprot:CAMPEP_0201494590 /NCGR_PEP_ID=MMETSP0151_2-20130828/48579_1 /ASSEMBLY_ACC=CAM_ASM_000257 /TAXON_ID=200890 /ORGANISM="Paramoeba atlantica, Strain 621/1 / CCAP 1560/9" /LENGTH=243 /DNA_ID=CAMNT_0047882959 /DNA_START=44 /DNA_END=775 /DNA_ORIENTATION=+